MNTFCHIKDSLCFTFSQNLVTKVAFLPLSENEISSETEILHGVDDLFYPQHLHHQQKCCFSRGLLGRAVGVSYAVWHGGKFMLPVADGQMPDHWPDTWIKEGPWPSAKLDWRLTRDMNGTHEPFAAAGSNLHDFGALTRPKKTALQRSMKARDWRENACPKCIIWTL